MSCGKEKQINSQIIELTKNFTNLDMFAYRRGRNWGYFDKLNKLDKLYYIKKEVEAYIANHKRINNG